MTSWKMHQGRADGDSPVPSVLSRSQGRQDRRGDPPAPAAVYEVSCQPIHGRRVAMDLAQVVVEEIDVAAGDLQR